MVEILVSKWRLWTAMPMAKLPFYVKFGIFSVFVCYTINLYSWYVTILYLKNASYLWGSLQALVSVIGLYTFVSLGQAVAGAFKTAIEVAHERSELERMSAQGDKLEFELKRLFQDLGIKPSGRPPQDIN